MTNVDREAQQIITEAITRSYPEHQFLGEEDEKLWECSPRIRAAFVDRDPIDGTTNFSRQIPHFCVSLACAIKGKIEHAVIITPSPMMNTSPQEAKAPNSMAAKFALAREQIAGSVCLCGPLSQGPVRDGHAKICEAIDEGDGNFREPGSAALELANLAAGRIDGVWIRRVNLWDFAAGALLVQKQAV